MKAVLDKVDIAAIMGHGSLETASSHYGRRTAGRARLLPNLPTIIASPSETSVAAVHAWADRQPRAECGRESRAPVASPPLLKHPTATAAAHRAGRLPRPENEPAARDGCSLLMRLSGSDSCAMVECGPA
ncbi:protein of unknown function [Magnetospirillum gryphiswaldense MSR-1 v2]|uniref:Uncharacterized protein n=1 Tax=Magnetospirillum gryphiswaldense (strain DSM 6361 / JCM 21280 / NBRC 15271 / MSR-1) TaxID=431944 RepID=V6F649_MAGGM|nr:protein of unknown function [Magnetospirillum gryphiswaldense MSR-1 v2]